MSLTADDGLRHEYLEQSQIMPDAGWTVRVLLDTAYLRAQARIVLCGHPAADLRCRLCRSAGVAAAQGASPSAWPCRRRRRPNSNAGWTRAPPIWRRVNSQIETEIAERRLTEQELRRTQADLIQAGKLAALGQMSAALSHEINQPLAAARNYADSAAILIDRGDTVRARENISQILSLIDRMAMIGKHLRNVARKPNEPLQDVDTGADGEGGVGYPRADASLPPV